MALSAMEYLPPPGAVDTMMIKTHFKISILSYQNLGQDQYKVNVITHIL